MSTVLADHRSAVLPGRIVEIEHARKLQTSIDNVAGNAASWAVARGLPFEVAYASLPDHIRDALRERIDQDPRKQAKKTEEVELRHRFIIPK